MLCAGPLPHVDGSGMYVWVLAARYGQQEPSGSCCWGAVMLITPGSWRLATISGCGIFLSFQWLGRFAPKQGDSNSLLEVVEFYCGIFCFGGIAAICNADAPLQTICEHNQLWGG